MRLSAAPVTHYLLGAVTATDATGHADGGGASCGNGCVRSCAGSQCVRNLAASCAATALAPSEQLAEAASGHVLAGSGAAVPAGVLDDAPSIDDVLREAATLANWDADAPEPLVPDPDVLDRISDHAAEADYRGKAVDLPQVWRKSNGDVVKVAEAVQKFFKDLLRPAIRKLVSGAHTNHNEAGHAVTRALGWQKGVGGQTTGHRPRCGAARGVIISELGFAGVVPVVDKLQPYGATDAQCWAYYKADLKQFAHRATQQQQMDKPYTNKRTKQFDIASVTPAQLVDGRHVLTSDQAATQQVLREAEQAATYDLQSNVRNADNIEKAAAKAQRARARAAKAAAMDSAADPDAASALAVAPAMGTRTCSKKGKGAKRRELLDTPRVPLLDTDRQPASAAAPTAVTPARSQRTGAKSAKAAKSVRRTQGSGSNAAGKQP